MAIDLNNAYDSVEEKIKSSKTYMQVKKDTGEIIKKQKNNLDKAKKEVTTTVDNLKNQQKRFQRQVKTQLDQLLSVFQFNAGSGPETFQYLKKKFIQAALIIEPKIFEIINKETIHALGCSQQQAYDGQVVYIKVKSVDIQKLLKRDPTGENASLSYEKTPPTPNSIPYSMNREMWERLQNLNVPVDYYGASGQKLFEISYVQTDGNGNSGDFYKIALTNRVNGLNTVSNFIVDYYKSIKILDTTNIFAQLMDQISGAVSFDANVGSGELDEKNKFLLLLQRILGLCFDSKREIDVSGNSKIAELDGIDDSFFEFTDIDLRYIDQLVSNIQNGVVEFEDCQNVLLPVDSQSIMDSLIKFNKSNKNELESAQQLTNALTDNEKWKFLIPTSVDIKLSVDLSFLTNLPKAIMMALLSPKVLLPLMTMAKAIGQSIGDFVESLLTLIKHFKKYVIKLMAEIGGLFVKELFELIKKDIRTLIDEIIKDISKEKILKKYVIVLRLIELILIVAKFVDDWKKCKSVVDEILSLLNLVSKSLGIGSKVPSFLLAASQLLDGFSNTRATINIIQEFQKLGLPTGPMPDGSPNLTLQSEVARVKGIFQEASENGKTQVFIKPLTITPAGVTLPTGDTFGKWY